MGKTLSRAERARRAGLSPAVVNMRLRSGWPKRLAFTAPLGTRFKPYRMPVKPGSLRQRCLAARLNYSMVFGRIANGWPEKLAFTAPSGTRFKRGKIIPGSISQKAKSTKVPLSTIYSRLRHGWPERLAFTAPLGTQFNPKPVWSSDPANVLARLKRRTRQEMASILLGRRASRREAEKFHRDLRLAGAHKKSLAEEARDAGLAYQTVQWRMRRKGMSREMALSLPLPPPLVTLTSKARASGLDYNMVRMRIKNGWSEDRALSTPPLR